MFKMDGFIYRACSWICNFALLNILYILSCLLVVTVFPATAALFGVTRQWVKGQDIKVFQQYKKLFIENFKQSFVIGLLSAIVGLFLMLDFYFLTQLKTTYKPFVFTVLLIGSFMVWATLSSLYPLMVHRYYSTKELIKNAFKISFYKPHLTFIQLILSIVWFYLSIRFDFLIFFFSFSGFAYYTYWFIDRKFKKLIPEPVES